jgi:hypothetical protein
VHATCPAQLTLLDFITQNEQINVFMHTMTVLRFDSFAVETWSLTWRKEQRLRAFEDKMLWRIFGPMREEVVGGWRRMHNEDLHNLYTSQYIITVIKWRRIRWVGHVVHTGEMRNAYKILVRKPE